MAAKKKKKLNFAGAELKKTCFYNSTYLFFKVEPVVKEYSKIFYLLGGRLEVCQK